MPSPGHDGRVPLEPDPFADEGQGMGKVHLWHGAYISEKLPWVVYHELPKSGHLFPIADVIVESLLGGPASMIPLVPVNSVLIMQHIRISM